MNQFHSAFQNEVRKKKVTRLVLIISALIVTFIYLLSHYHIAGRINNNDSIGIIDVMLSEPMDNVVYSTTHYQEVSADEKSISHGNELIAFARHKGYTGVIYYYSAVSEDGLIHTDAVIEGLEWMLSQGVSKVNISLSSKHKDDELAAWILKHHEIQVYASYNNNVNSSDYPAMYEGVIGSGKPADISYKDIDVVYSSNKIIVPSSDGIKVYTGNSYLSMETMLGS